MKLKKLQRLRNSVHLSTRFKMIAGFLSVSLFSVLLMAIFTQMYYTKATKADFFAISVGASSRLNHQMDFYIRQLIQSTSTLIAGPLASSLDAGKSADPELIQRWLRNDNDYTRADIARIEDTLRRYVALNYSEIVNMFVVSADRNVVSMYGSFLDTDANYRNEPWYYLAMERQVRILPTHLTRYPQFAGVPVVSIVIPIYSTEDAGLIGRLVIDIKLKQIESILGKFTLGQSGFFFIVADNGTIVYHPNADNWGLPRQLTDLRSLDLSSQTSVQPWGDKEVLLASSRSDFTDWNVAAIVPYEEMASGLAIARNSTLAVVLILSLLVILLVPLLSHRFVQPILRLTNTVSDLQIREVQLELRQKEAVIQALQNQINPHLLYNTLDIIKSMAYLEKVPKIERIARNLADVYRYTAKSPDLEVTLGEELEHLRNYLQIVHIRFPKHFQSHLVVNPKYAACPIVRLTLQPLVENAVKYAIEPLGGKGAIFVSAYHTDSTLIVEIADNGPGIPEERLIELQESIARITRTGSDPIVQHESLGIANVHARLVLRYGEAYGLGITSFIGRGAIVSIRLPLRDFAEIG
ncbi:MAG: histidine kinase [Paenibacillaceae bacterium]|jgi:two-component system sensor histidine kinase YesM|nr:histidine kinase [Paenibacillaceae bacterium]